MGGAERCPGAVGTHLTLGGEGGGQGQRWGMCLPDNLGTISGLMKGERKAPGAPRVESPLNELQGGLVGVPGYGCLSCSVSC